MIDGSITVVGNDLHDLRNKLGFYSGNGYVNVTPTGPAGNTMYSVRIGEERRIVRTPEAAGKLIVAFLKRANKVTKRGGKSRKLRPNTRSRK